MNTQWQNVKINIMANSGKMFNATNIAIFASCKTQDKPVNASNALKFFEWAYGNGDQAADDLDYVPLPDSVKALVRQHWAANIKDAAGKAIAFK